MESTCTTPCFPSGTPPGAVHHGVLLDAVLHPADLDVLGADGAVHRHDPEAPRRKGLADLRAGVLLGGLPALVHELHEARALRVRGVLPRPEDEVFAVRRHPDVHRPLAFGNRNLLGQEVRSGPGGAGRGVASRSFRSRTTWTSSFCCALSQVLLVRLLLLRRVPPPRSDGWRHRGDVVFPEIAALRDAFCRETLGREEDLAAVGEAGGAVRSGRRPRRPDAFPRPPSRRTGNPAGSRPPCLPRRSGRHSLPERARPRPRSAPEGSLPPGPPRTTDRRRRADRVSDPRASGNRPRCRPAPSADRAEPARRRGCRRRGDRGSAGSPDRRRRR